MNCITPDTFGFPDEEGIAIGGMACSPLAARRCRVHVPATSATRIRVGESVCINPDTVDRLAPRKSRPISAPSTNNHIHTPIMKTKTPFLKFIIPVVAVSLQFTVAPSAKAANSHDIDGDGHSDLLFQNSAGQVYAWLLDGTGNGVDFSNGSGLKPGSKFIYGGSLGDWKMAGMSDLNGDGMQDLVFQNSAGQIYAWFLDGTGNSVNFSTGSGLKPGSKFIYSGGLSGWKLKGMDDLNGDGITDLVFQNSAGQIYAWFLDGSGNAVDFRTGSGLKPGSKFIYGGGLGDWSLEGTRDINGDGIADLVFQNRAGQVYAWLLDGTGNSVMFAKGSGIKAGSKFIYSGGMGDWKFKGMDDVNHDGIADLLFQNNVGQVYAWFLDGSGNEVNFSTGSGLKPGSKFMYGGALGDWKMNGDDANHDIGDDHGGLGESEQEASLTRSGSAPNGSKAKVELSIVGSEIELELQVEDVPVGNYDVSVGGVVRGVISVVAAGGGTKGRLKFESSPDQAGEALLNFAASGQAVQISKSGTVYFTGNSPTAP